MSSFSCLSIDIVETLMVKNLDHTSTLRERSEFIGGGGEGGGAVGGHRYIARGFRGGGGFMIQCIELGGAYYSAQV